MNLVSTWAGKFVLLVVLSGMAFPQEQPSETTQQSPPETSQPATSNADEHTQPEASSDQKPTSKAVTPCRNRPGHKCPQSAPGEPRRVVVHRGSTAEPTAQIVPGMTAEQANRQRQNAEGLLAAAETDLKRLSGRTLNTQQQDTVSQVRNYMNGVRSALRSGDTERAQTLALKANLLMEDLMKH